MNPRKLYRSGDVLLLESDELPKDAKEEGSPVILAQGTVTGHSHKLTPNRSNIKNIAKRFKSGARDYVQVLTPCRIIHEEHKAVPVPKGIYEVRIQQEFDPAGMRNVAD
jgi:hypothetical protein